MEEASEEAKSFIEKAFFLSIYFYLAFIIR